MEEVLLIKKEGLGLSKTKTHSPAREGGKWIRPEKREAIYQRDNYTCLYCGRKKVPGIKLLLTLDHIVPPPMGSNRKENLITTCFQCNQRKQKMGFHAFLWKLKSEGYDIISISNLIRRQTKKVIFVKGRAR